MQARTSSSTRVEGTAACPITRTAGDRLLAFDYLNGGTNLDLHVLTWIDSTDTTAGGNSRHLPRQDEQLPCWGANVLSPYRASVRRVSASQAAIAGGRQRPSTARRSSPGNSPSSVSTSRRADLDPQGSARGSHRRSGSREHRGSASRRTPRTSTSTTRTSPTVGRITIIKRTSPGDVNKAFAFTSTIPNPSGTVTTDSSPYCRETRARRPSR